jgi:hypothetical protein
MMDLRKMSNEGRCRVSFKTYENDPKRTFYECFIHTLLIRGRVIANHDDTIMDTPNDIETFPWLPPSLPFNVHHQPCQHGGPLQMSTTTWPSSELVPSVSKLPWWLHLAPSIRKSA